MGEGNRVLLHSLLNLNKNNWISFLIVLYTDYSFFTLDSENGFVEFCQQDFNLISKTQSAKGPMNAANMLS